MTTKPASFNVATGGAELQLLTWQDLGDFLLAPHRLIGEGAYRKVYDLFDGYVLKVEEAVDGTPNFNNAHEMSLWIDLRGNTTGGTWWAGYLAPCHAISNGGRLLVQSRVKPVTLTECRKNPLRPNFWSDLKVGNYGMYKGRLVCCDYGSDSMTRMIGQNNFKMIKNKANDWWE